MKTSIKMILALALALTMICALGTAAFADTPIIITKNPTGLKPDQVGLYILIIPQTVLRPKRPDLSHPGDAHCHRSLESLQ